MNDERETSGTDVPPVAGHERDARATDAALREHKTVEWTMPVNPTWAKFLP